MYVRRYMLLTSVTPQDTSHLHGERGGRRKGEKGEGEEGQVGN